MISRLPELAECLPAAVQLDGELIAWGDDGTPDFHRLGRRMLHGDTSSPVTYVAFDVLALEGEPTLRLPYAERHPRILSNSQRFRSLQKPRRPRCSLQAQVPQARTGAAPRRPEHLCRLIRGGWDCGSGERASGAPSLRLLPATSALPASGPVVMQPGDTLSVDGTQIACLAFGANVQTLTERGPGVFCARATVGAGGTFTVMRGSQATLFNSYVYALVPANSHAAEGVLGTPLPPRSTPRRHFRVGLGDVVKVRGASFACSVFTSETISPGQRTIGCYETDANGATPRSIGVAISDRLAAAVRVSSNRQFGSVLERKRHQ